MLTELVSLFFCPTSQKPVFDLIFFRKEPPVMDYDTQLINLALDAGEIMLASGAETFRVQDTMQRILSVDSSTWDIV